jgi:hypothetical protein
MGIGLVASVLLARTLKSIGFYLVGLFFLSPVFGWVEREISYIMHREAINAYAAEQNRKLQSGEIIPEVKTDIRLPVFETFLVAGLILVLRKSNRPNKAPEPTTTSVTSPAAQEPRQP